MDKFNIEKAGNQALSPNILLLTFVQDIAHHIKRTVRRRILRKDPSDVVYSSTKGKAQHGIALWEEILAASSRMVGWHFSTSTLILTGNPQRPDTSSTSISATVPSCCSRLNRLSKPKVPYEI